MLIEDIAKQVKEQTDNEICKAFTLQISDILLKNGIRIWATMNIAEQEEVRTDFGIVYKTKYNVSLDNLDASKHDKQVRIDLINYIKRSLHDIYSQSFYCTEDLCEKEDKGYSCEDCFYKFLDSHLDNLIESEEKDIEAKSIWDIDQQE